MKPLRRRQGSVLSWVLLMFLLMMTLVLMVASSSGLYWRSANLMVRDSLAANLGDSLVAQALAHLKQSSSYGKNGEKLELSLSSVGEPTVFGNLTFGDKPEGSINNIDGSYTGPGYGGQMLPTGTVQLVVHLSARDRLYHQVVIVSKSPFPYVVSTSGSFTSNGSLLLGNLRTLGDLRDGLQDTDLTKGQLLANGSLTMSAPARVAGDLKTAGTASVAGVTFLTGGYQENVAPEDIPHLNLGDYDPRGKPEIVELRPAELGPTPLTVAGLMRLSGSATLTRKLTLNGGVLYAEGDLTLNQGVEGYGAVFCTGNLTVSGGADLGSDSLCALVAGGDLSVSGAGADRTQFRGLVYSAGALTVSDITVVGSLVGSSTSGAPMTVTRANLVYDPEAVALDFDLQWSGFGPLLPHQGGVSLRPGQTITPQSAYNRDTRRFDLPTLGQVESMLLYHVPGQLPRPFMELTADEMEQMQRHGLDAQHAIVAQLEDWNARGLNPQSLRAEYSLDLNRFVKVARDLKILRRQLRRQ